MQAGNARKSCSIRKIAIASSVAVMFAWGAAVPAATYTWVGGNGGDPNDFNDAANWAPTGGPPGHTSPNDVAYFNTGQSNQPQLQISDTIGELDFNTSGWMLSSSSTSNLLTLDSTISGGGGIGILSAATSGINEISANLSIGAAQTWEVASGGTLQIDGVLSNTNTAGLTIGAAGYGGTVLLTNANPNFTGGGLVVNTGTLELGGATINSTQQFGTLTGATAITIGSGGIFEINNTTAAGGNASNRLNSPVMVFNGGKFVYVGSDVAGTASTETLGSVDLNTGPISTITVTLPSANSNGSAQVTLGTLSQYTPNTTATYLPVAIYSGTMLINGVNLGLTGGGTVLTNNTSALNLQGNGQAAAGTESAGTYNLQIAPFLLGESGLGSGQGGTATGTPNTFLTYNGTTGFRPLNPTDEFAHSVTDGSDGNTATVGDNIYITASQSAALSGNNSINSLVINGSGSPTLTIPSGIALTDSSGALLFATNGTIAGGTLDFGQSNSANNDVNITVNPGQTGTINSNVTGTGTSMNVTGGGSLVFGGNATFKNGIAANNATVTFAEGWNPAGTNLYLMNAYDGSTFNFDGSSTIPVSGDTSSMQMYIFNSTVNVNGSLTFTGGSNVYQQWNLGNSTFNIGSASGTESAALNANGASGVIFAADLGNGTVNVYSGATLSVPNGTAEIAKGAVGDVVVNIDSGGTAILKSVVLGDNGGTATAGIVGAIYLQSGANLNITTTTSGIGVFSIGASGGGKPTGSTGGGGENNDYGYVSVPSGATIGNGTSNTPGEMDIAGVYRGTPVGGGNGLMDVTGGTVNVGGTSTTGGITMAGSTIDQQFGVLNVLSGGTVTTSGVLTMSGGSTEASAGIYGSYSNINLSGGSSFSTGVKLSINLAGSSVGAETGTEPYAVNLLPTGIINVGSSSKLTVGYVRSGTVSVTVGGTTYDGNANSFVNINGGTLNSSGNSVFLYQSAGYYIYNGGATLTGTGESINAAFFAPPGAAIPTGAVTGSSVTGGSGYTTPPIVVISDSTGFDATGYATINSSGQVTGVVITNGGFNMTNPTVTLIGGGGTGASVTLPSLISNPANNSGGLTIGAGTSGTFTLAGAFGGPDPNGAHPVYSFTNSNGSDNYNITGTSNTVGIAAAGSGLGNNPYAAGTYYGYSYSGIRNNTSTYTGPTVVELGTLALSDAASSTTANGGSPVGPFAATNNNIPFSSVIVVGDTGTDNAAVLNITAVASGKGGFELAPGLINSVSYNGSTYAYTSNPQALSGFGAIIGSSTAGLTIGLASGNVTATSSGTTSTGNNFGGYAYASSGTWTPAPSINNSLIAPGYTNLTSAPAYTGTPSGYNSNAPYYGAIVTGAGTGSSGTPAGTQAFTFNTQYGGAPADLAGSAPQPTGRLILSESATGSGATASNAMTTTLGAGGIYYWKLNLGTAGTAGSTTTPGAETSAGASTSGAAWDALVADALVAGTATTSSPFTVEAYGFNLANEQSSPVTIGNGYTQSYSWAIARVGYVNNGSGLVAATSTTLAPLLADLSLNTNGLPQAASGYEYFLNTENDPSGGADLVVNYAPVPEPTALSLLGLGAGALMIRRRRKSIPAAL